MTDLELAQRVFSCIDNTTLAATDHSRSVKDFCRHTAALRLADGTTVAAVCVYPAFVEVACRALSGSGIHVASVAGAFPHGQMPLQLKVAEVRRAVEDGADEVDIVINRGLLLAGCDNDVRREVEAMKEACCGRTLKVILETCDLPSPTLVEKAARIAIEGGADFIKTSTGKGQAGATLLAAETMLGVVRDTAAATGRMVGFKAAGGIRQPDEALAYARLAMRIMGDGYIDRATFRIGASSLTDKVYSMF